MLFEEFYRLVKDLKLTKNTHKIVVAVSGGVDSVVLLHLLMRIPDSARPQVIIAHINHQLRSEASAEVPLVQKKAEHYQLPFHLHTWPVTKQPLSGIEEAARKMRYEFFQKVMDETSANILMTGHHQDDQVETILMKLTRGSLLRQLTGIELQQSFNKGQLIRPLLYFSKEQIYEYAHNHNLKYAEDDTNRELTFSRNRFRNILIPQFKAENAQFNEHIEQFASDLDDLLEIAAGPIQKAWREIVTATSEENISFTQKSFLKYPKSMQRALLQQVLIKLYKNSQTGYKANYITVIQNWIISGAVNTELELSEARRVLKQYDKIVFYIDEEKQTAEIKNNHSYQLTTLNEWVRVSDNESFRLTSFYANAETIAEKDEYLLISAAKLHLPLTIRHRLAGDRMSYQGLKGTKKIKDIFIDEKTPPNEREKAWVVEDAAGKIVWLVNYRKMGLFTPEETDRLCYILEYKKE